MTIIICQIVQGTYFVINWLVESQHALGISIVNKLHGTLAGMVLLALVAPSLPWATPMSSGRACLGGSENIGIAHALATGDADAMHGRMGAVEVYKTAGYMEPNTVTRHDDVSPPNELRLFKPRAMLLFGVELVGFAAAFRRFVKE